MALLHRSEYKTLLPSEIAPWLACEEASSKNAVCLTFDDAYEDFFTSAFPVLQKFGFKSTVYVPTGLVGSKGPQGIKLMNWSQILELSKYGVHFGSHTVTHSNLSTLTEIDACQEFSESQKALENALGKPVCDFSHPFSFPENDKIYVSHYKRNLHSCGYQTSVTTILGSVKIGSDMLMISRLPINHYDDARLFCAKLNHAYDWLHSIQTYYKHLRSHL